MKTLLVLWLLAGAIRALLFYGGFAAILGNRIELTTPVTSLTRVKEGLFLQENGFSPYAGDEFHQAPLLLTLLHPIEYMLGSQENAALAMHSLFIFLDLLIALILRGIAISMRSSPFFVTAGTLKRHKELVTRCKAEEIKEKREKEEREKKEKEEREKKEKEDKDKEVQKEEEDKPKEGEEETEEKQEQPSGLRNRNKNGKEGEKSAKKNKNKKKQNSKNKKKIATVVPPDSESSSLPDIIMAIYLLNPWTIMTCVAQSTVVFNNLAILICLYGGLRGNVALASLGYALATYLSLYPVVLIVPIILMLAVIRKKGIVFMTSLTVTLSLLWLGGLFGLSYLQLNSWEWLKEVYGFIVYAPDLTPNIGLFWYYFTEVFKELRPFFTFLFQYHFFVYWIPLTIVYRHDPVFLYWAFVTLMAMLKSYPCIGDTLLYITLLPLFPAILYANKWSVLVGHMLSYLTIMIPVTWYIWIEKGTGNANFLYAATLVFFVAQSWLLRDCMTSNLAIRKYKRLYEKYSASPYNVEAKKDK